MMVLIRRIGYIIPTIQRTSVTIKSKKAYQLVVSTRTPFSLILQIPIECVSAFTKSGQNRHRHNDINTK